MAQNTAAIAAYLDEINTTLQQGLTLAEDKINQLDAAAQQAKASIDATQAQAQSWLQNVQTNLNNRAVQALAIRPNASTTDRAGALQNVPSFPSR